MDVFPQRFLAVALLLFSACSVSLDVPEGATILCDADAECPEGYTCSSGVCEQTLVNVAPTVTVRAAGRDAATLPLEVTVADANGVTDRREEVSVELAVVVGGARCPLTTLDPPLDGIATTRAGVTVSAVWDAIADASSTCGLIPRPADRNGDGIADAQVLPLLADVVIEATAIDASGARGATSSASVTLGNDTPTAIFEPTQPAVSNDVPLAFTVDDTSLDLADIDLQFALPSSPDTWRAARIRYGATSDLVTDGSQQVVVWESLAADGGVGAVRVAGVKLRLRARDDVGGPDYGAFDEVTLSVDNQSAPAVTSLQLGGDTFGKSTGITYLIYRLVDAQSDATDVRVEVSIDDEPAKPCTPHPNEMHSGVHTLASAPATDDGGGVAHVFAWDVAADLGTRNTTNVVVRVVPADERAGVGAAASLQLGSRVGLGASYAGSGGYKLQARTTTSLGEIIFVGAFDSGPPDVATMTDAASYVIYGNSGGTFTGATEIWPSSDPLRAGAAGDLNGDSYDDFVFLVAFNQLHIYYGGAGGLTIQQSVNLPGACEPHGRKLSIGDFNGDGQNEIAFRCDDGVHVAVRSTSWTVDGTTYAAGANVIRLAAGDVDGDGRDELIIAHRNTAPTTAAELDVHVLPGQNAAQLLGTPVALVTGLPLAYTNAPRFNEQGADVAAADLDGDGRAEIVVASTPFRTSGSVRVYRGADLAAPPVMSDVLPERPGYLSIADVDGNGSRDIVTWACTETDAPCVYMHALATSTLTPIGRARLPAVTCTNVSRSSGEAADLDADGRAELVVAEVCGGTAGLLTYTLGSGATPTPLTDVTALSEAPLASNELTVVDFDRDGALDVMVSQTSSLITQVRAGAHQLPSVAPGVSLFAVGQYEADFDNISYYRVVPADFTGDGTPDLYTSNRTFPTAVRTNVATSAADGSYGFEGLGYATFSGAPDRVLAAADVNGDGFEDLIGRIDDRVIVMRANVSGGVWAGTFSSILDFDTGFVASIDHVAIADMDRDGDLDVVGATSAAVTGPCCAPTPGPGVIVLMNNGGGGFSELCRQFTNGAQSTRMVRGVTVADTIDDGYPDVVVAFQGNPTVMPLETTGIQIRTLSITSAGCGTFSGQAQEVPLGPVDRFDAADIDGDGIRDVFGVGSGKVLVWANRQADGLANGVIDTPVNLTNQLVRAEVADFDRDGMADIVGVSSGTAVLMLHGVQQNGFAPRTVTLSPDALIGVVLPRTVDAFGVPIPVKLGLRRYNGLGRFAEPVHVDFPGGAARAGVLGNTKRALTRAFELEGLLRLTDAGDGRYRVEETLDLDAQAGRAVVIDLPLPAARWPLNLASNVRVVMRADDFVRANEYASDPLYGLPAGADVLPITLGRESPVIERTSTWLDITRDPDGDLSTGTGRRFIVENSGSAHRVRVVLDVPGVVQAFVQ